MSLHKLNAPAQKRLEQHLIHMMHNDCQLGSREAEVAPTFDQAQHSNSNVRHSHSNMRAKDALKRIIASEVTCRECGSEHCNPCVRTGTNISSPVSYNDAVTIRDTQLNNRSAAATHSDPVDAFVMNDAKQRNVDTFERHPMKKLPLSKRLSTSLDSVLSTMGVKIEMLVTTKSQVKRTHEGSRRVVEPADMSESSTTTAQRILHTSTSGHPLTLPATYDRERQGGGVHTTRVSSSKKSQFSTTRTTNSCVRRSSHHLTSSPATDHIDPVHSGESGFETATDPGYETVSENGRSSCSVHTSGNHNVGNNKSGSSSNRIHTMNRSSNSTLHRRNISADDCSTLTLVQRNGDLNQNSSSSAYVLANKFENLNKGLVVGHPECRSQSSREADGDNIAQRHRNVGLQMRSTSISNGSLSEGSDLDEHHDPSVKVFEQKKSYSSSHTTAIEDGCFKENATARQAQMTQVLDGDSAYRENTSSCDSRSKLQINGVLAVEGTKLTKEDRHMRQGDVTHDESSRAAMSDASVSRPGFRVQKWALVGHQHAKTANDGRVMSKQDRNNAALQWHISYNRPQQRVETPTSPAVTSAMDELEMITNSTDPLDNNQAVIRCGRHLTSLLTSLTQSDEEEQSTMLQQVDLVVQQAWSMPTGGPQTGHSLANVLRKQGGLDSLIRSCEITARHLQKQQRQQQQQQKQQQLKRQQIQNVPIHGVRVLNRCLTTENQAYVVEKGLVNRVARTASLSSCAGIEKEDSRAVAEILELMMKHNEGTCSDVIRSGGLDAVLYQCMNDDIETLRHCAVALANLSLYGGPENQMVMLKRKAPNWLFRLAFHSDHCVKYYACLAIVTMVANKEIEAAILRSGTLELVAPLVTSHEPDKCARYIIATADGHSSSWLEKLLPVLQSAREEARNLAAFHFCMEAIIKKELNRTDVFQQIGAIEPLQMVASMPNDIAARFAARTLCCLGVEVPHKLSQHVPLWSVSDVATWVKQIDFHDFEHQFIRSRVDGDLLLRLNDTMLNEDIGMRNGILRRRFIRELDRLKQIADYSCCDTTHLHEFLLGLAPDYSIYTYPMLMCGIDRNHLRYLNEEQLQHECGVENSIHRYKLQEAIKRESLITLPPAEVEKTLDCFISYRRSNGSQLASLLKVHLELRGFSVFIDVERLEAGKFGNNLINSIYQASNFILVLTPNALDRCIDDEDGRDWVRKETNAALKSRCNIVPILDSFEWPKPEMLPEDIRPICKFNGIRWIHDYQEACVDKLERFMRRMANNTDQRAGRVGGGNGGSGCLHPMMVSPCISRCHSPAPGYVSPHLQRRRGPSLAVTPPLSTLATPPQHRPLRMMRSRSLDDAEPEGLAVKSSVNPLQNQRNQRMTYTTVMSSSDEHIYDSCSSPEPTINGHD